MPASSLPDPKDLLAKLIADRRHLDDLDRLVSAESPSCDPGALRTCRSVLEDIGTRLLGERPTVLPGADVREGSGTPGGLLWRLGPSGHPPVLLVGHLDTVWPLRTLRHWPFDVRESRATGPACST